MAVISVWSATSKKSHIHPDITGIRHIERETTEYYLPSRAVSRCFSLSLLGESQRKWNVSPHGSQLNLKASRRQGALACGQAYNRCTQLKTTVGIPLPKVYNKDSHGKRHSRGSGFYALATDSSQEQLKTLDSYFSKLHNDMDEQFNSCRNDSDVEENHMKSSVLEGKVRGISTTSSHKYRRKTTLDSLENYFEELNTGGGMKNGTSPTVDQEFLGRPIRRPNSVFRGYPGKQRMPIEVGNFDQFKSMDDESNEVVFGNENIQGVQRYDEASDFYLINLLVAINIAVFLFEIASPVLNSELEQLSLPLIYGAKINELILGGDWWRLLTPMFLHSGFLHIALGCWVLLTFGPQVCRGYGPFTFFLIYLLGGICGNLTSFIHTPDLTVCGTGPVFAIIGAWLVYQIQNKQVVEKDLAESLFWKAVISTALGFVLSNFGRIDDWTHLGSALSGIIFGYLTCPTLQLLDNLSSSSGNDRKQDGIALLRQQADPCKSLLIFTIAILILSCLVFGYEPQLEVLVDGFS